MSDNPLNCDCKVSWLQKQLQTSSEFGNASVVICTSPSVFVGRPLAGISEELTCTSSFFFQTPSFHPDTSVQQEQENSIRVGQISNDTVTAVGGGGGLARDSLGRTLSADFQLILVVVCVMSALITGKKRNFPEQVMNKYQVR